MSDPRPLYAVRFFVYGGRRHLPGVCDEEIVIDGDPFVFARRALKLDAMREEGAGWSRAEVFRLNDGSFLRTVRVSKKLLDRFSVHGAVRRGVRNRGLRKLCEQLGILYPGR